MDKTVLKRKLLGQFLPRLGRIGLTTALLTIYVQVRHISQGPGFQEVSVTSPRTFTYMSTSIFIFRAGI